MNDNRRPQEYAASLADADICKVKRSERTIGQHSVKRLAGRIARPAGHPETDQPDAPEAADHTSYADDLGAEQKPNHDRRVRQQGEPRGRLACGSDSKHDVHLNPLWMKADTRYGIFPLISRIAHREFRITHHVSRDPVRVLVTCCSSPRTTVLPRLERFRRPSLPSPRLGAAGNFPALSGTSAVDRHSGAASASRRR